MRKKELTMAQLVQPNQTNHSGNIHGGEMMKMMDSVAAATAMQYARSYAVTARVDELQFLLPIQAGELVTCTGRIAYVGRTSMEVLITVEVENLQSAEERKCALTAFFTMVSLDEQRKPKAVEPFLPETEEEEKLYRLVKARKSRYRRHRRPDERS